MKNKRFRRYRSSTVHKFKIAITLIWNCYVFTIMVKGLTRFWRMLFQQCPRVFENKKFRSRGRWPRDWVYCLPVPLCIVTAKLGRSALITIYLFITKFITLLIKCAAKLINPSSNINGRWSLVMDKLVNHTLYCGMWLLTHTGIKTILVKRATGNHPMNKTYQYHAKLIYAIWEPDFIADRIPFSSSNEWKNQSLWQDKYFAWWSSWSSCCRHQRWNIYVIH